MLGYFVESSKHFKDEGLRFTRPRAPPASRRAWGRLKNLPDGKQKKGKGIIVRDLRRCREELFEAGVQKPWRRESTVIKLGP
jgi:hypothetical protein